MTWRQWTRDPTSAQNPAGIRPKRLTLTLASPLRFAHVALRMPPEACGPVVRNHLWRTTDPKTDGREPTLQ